MENQEKQGIAEPQTETKPLIKSYRGDGKNVIFGITGASGSVYAVRILRALILNNFNIDLIITEYGHYTLAKECGMELNHSNLQSYFPELILNKCTVSFHSNLDLKSEIFSVSYNAHGVIVAPCAMGYISQIANGESTNLIVKCSDYALSYSRPLIVVPSETPFNRIQLGNMMKILDAGGKVVPAMPAFDNSPNDFNDLGDYIAVMVLNLLMQGGRKE